MVKPWEFNELTRRQQLDLMAWYEINMAEEVERQRKAQRDAEKAKIHASSKSKPRGRSRR